MATFFHLNSEIQAGDVGMQTLYLMNPNYVPYSDHHTTSLPNNTHLLNPVNLSHAPPQPLLSNDDHQHLLWSSSDTHMTSLAAAASNSAPLGLPRPVAMSVPSRHQQGLSLSLSESSPSSVSVVSSAILGSKYLRAAQELLDEVVKVENLVKTYSVEDEIKEKMELNRESKMAAVDHQEPNGTTGESSKKSHFELTTVQRQELQIKKAKLVNILDEVEQRYRQYHHQMQLVVSAFEQAAGFGSAKSYTAVALRTISKQFRCLKDAISAQLKETSKKLGEDDCLGAKIGSSRLRFVDQQLRQQRALQQLGMMQHHSWRAQRGLPERAVTILRAWLFEHFLHPYPKDSDKQLLAKQTGLTRSQVSNWFINARVRLWKPMVEEMYLEEVKEKEGNVSESKESTQLEQIKALQAKAEKSTTHIASSSEFSNSTISTSPMGRTLQQQTSFNLIGPSDLEGFVQRREKKPRNNADHLLNSPSRETGRERLSINDPGGGFGTYPMGADIERFNHDHHHHHHQLAAPTFHGNNGVSLTLGLLHCENLSLSGTQHNLLSGQNIDQLGRGLELGSSEPDFCPESSGYGSIEIHNRKRFAAQMLPDFMT